MITSGMMSSNTCEWATPQKFFDELNEKYHFEVDVCATPENAKCEKYYTKEDDGLSQEWRGMCYMNPPYGREIAKWVKKAYESTIGGVLRWYAYSLRELIQRGFTIIVSKAK